MRVEVTTMRLLNFVHAVTTLYGDNEDTIANDSELQNMFSLLATNRNFTRSKFIYNAVSQQEITLIAKVLLDNKIGVQLQDELLSA